MENNTQYYVDVISALAERTIKRLWILIALLVALLVCTNAAWIYYETSFEEVSVSQDIETETGDAFVSGVGDVNYGTDQTNR